MNIFGSIFGNFDEARRHANERATFAKKMAREQIERGAQEYIRLTGRASVMKRAEAIKGALSVYNDIAGSTARLSVPSIEAMIVAIGMVPGMTGIGLEHDKKFQDFQFSLQAIRLILKEDASAAAKRSLPPDYPQNGIVPPAMPSVV